MNRLVVADIHKGFGEQTVLHGVDLQVPGGSLTAVLGPSGSGKTTLLRVIAGFERADRGTVNLGDKVVDDAGRHFVPPEHRGIGYVPQEGSLFPNLTVERNVGFGLPRAALRDGRVGELLDMVGLADVARRYPHQLSGGQQQRVALARALAVRPTLVLLDEPFSSLDASMRQSVRDDVAEVLRRAGTTAVLVTHDQDEALSMADQVAVIRDGTVCQTGSPHGIYERPDDPGVAGFVGGANLVDGRLDGTVVHTALGPLALTAGGPPGWGSGGARVLLRPEQIELHRRSGSEEPEDATRPRGLTGRVTGYQYFGHDAVVSVRPDGDPGGAVLVVRVAGGGAFDPGDRVGLTARGPVVAWPAASGGTPGPGAAGGDAGSPSAGAPGTGHPRPAPSTPDHTS